MEPNIIENFKRINLNILNFCKKINRNPLKIKIVAVSKGQEKSKIENLLVHPHYRFGENRLEETLTKWKHIEEKKIKLHYLGALQSKKVSEIFGAFDVIETLDTESSAKNIANCILKKKKNIPKIFAQINIGNEKQKRGVPVPEFEDFLIMCKGRYNLNISGAMCLPPNNKNPVKYFKLMKDLCLKNNLNDISMGMSNDYLQAIEYGSTNIRIGTKIFGKRNKYT